MSLTNAPNAYPTEADAFDRAIRSPKGIRVEFSTEAEARTFRSRLHHLRALDRRENARSYDDPYRQVSDWDPLICSIQQDTTGKWWVYIQKTMIAAENVEEL